MAAQDWKLLAEQLDRELGLKHAPIAITFSEEAPQGVSVHEGEMPAPTPDGRSGKVSGGLCLLERWHRSDIYDSTRRPLQL